MSRALLEMFYKRFPTYDVKLRQYSVAHLLAAQRIIATLRAKVAARRKRNEQLRKGFEQGAFGKTDDEPQLGAPGRVRLGEQCRPRASATGQQGGLTGRRRYAPRASVSQVSVSTRGSVHFGDGDG